MLPEPLLELGLAEGVVRDPAAALAPDPAAEVVLAWRDWIVSASAQHHHPVRRYLFFLKWMYATFHSIVQCFPKQDHGRGGLKDSCTIASNPLEMLHLANHLYVLDSYGVPGAILECGCYKGFSTCCLSHAAAFLERTLYAADSFAGLPTPSTQEQGFYAAGDFAASLEEVQRNLETFGRPRQMTFLPGWFSESLRGWREPLALLWIDVDLYQSAADVLESVYPALDRRGAIFSHEFIPEYIQQGRITHPRESAGALLDFLQHRRLAYRAEHLHGHLARLSFPESVGTGSSDFLSAMIELFGWSDRP